MGRIEPSPAENGHGRAPLGAVLAITFMASIGSGVFWSGIFFVTEETYGFSSARTFLLAMAMGAVYTLGAFTSGKVARGLRRVVSARGLLGLLLVLQAIASLAPVTWQGEWTIWFAGCVSNWAASVLWPLMESYLTAGRHGEKMRGAIGWFNVVWTSAMMIPMLLAVLLLKDHGVWVIGALAPVNALACLFLRRLPLQPGSHDLETAAEHVGREYPLLLRSARVLLPLSYFLMAAMTPILPYRFEEMNLISPRIEWLDITLQWETPATATWMFARVAAVALMWRLGFWHGRWGMLLMGGLAVSGGFALAVAAPSLPVMLLGFALFGGGIGIIYYAALYYAMAVGRAAVKASGTHESLIGAGYTVGPIAGLLGAQLAGASFTGEALSPTGGIVAVVLLLILVGSVPAIGFYLRARRDRASSV